MKTLLLFAASALLCSCVIGPGYSNYEWRKNGDTTGERDRFLAEAQVAAIQAYPDPISMDQIHAEPINEPMIRTAKRNEVIINHMAYALVALVLQV